MLQVYWEHFELTWHSRQVTNLLDVNKLYTTACWPFGLVFQVMGVFSKEYIPQGTRFGPLQGDIYTKDSVPKEVNRKYFWRVRPLNTSVNLLLWGLRTLIRKVSGTKWRSLIFLSDSSGLSPHHREQSLSHRSLRQAGLFLYILEEVVSGGSL